jgi:hypothetical protein
VLRVDTRPLLEKGEQLPRVGERAALSPMRAFEGSSPRCLFLAQSPLAQHVREIVRRRRQAPRYHSCLVLAALLAAAWHWSVLSRAQNVPPKPEPHISAEPWANV